MKIVIGAFAIYKIGGWINKYGVGNGGCAGAGGGCSGCGGCGGLPHRHNFKIKNR
ncbi:MAG: hypothetical protein ACI88A_001851 [Paraglaciecola sp.]|jgi:hypothetical protein